MEFKHRMRMSVYQQSLCSVYHFNSLIIFFHIHFVDFQFERFNSDNSKLKKTEMLK